MGIRPRGAKSRRTFSIALIVLISTIPALSQARPGMVVEITASRIEEPSSVPPQAVTVLSSEAIAASGATTTASAVALAPGVEVTNKGPEGSQISATIRGSTSNQVLVLVDGVRVNDPLTGLADLSRIPLDSVDRVEIVRGGSSSLWGGDAVGGVINIITKRGARPFSISFENGSFIPQSRVVGFGFSKELASPSLPDLVDSQKISFAWGPRLGALGLRIAGSGTSAANTYTYVDSNSERRQRQNAGLSGADLSLGADLDLPDSRLSFDSSGALSYKGVPGSESMPSLTAHETDATARAVLAFSAERFLLDALSLDATAHVDFSSVDYIDRTSPADDGHHKSLTAGLELSQKAYLNDRLTLVYGSSIAWIGSSSNDLGAPSRVSAGAYFQPSMSFGLLTFRPSARYDYYSDFSPNSPLGGIGAGLGASFAIAPDRAIKLNFTRTYRVPSFDDLYWPAADGAAGNPGLVPETALEFDVGYSSVSRGASLDATLFGRYTRDVILWQPGVDGIWRPSNYGVALYPGAELALQAPIADGPTITVNYTYLRSYALDAGLGLADDRRLPYTPEHSLKATISGDFEPVTWTISETYSSPGYTSLANTATIPSHFVLDVLMKLRFSPAFQPYLAVDNFLDEQYSVISGYPMPGIKLRLGFEYRP